MLSISCIHTVPSRCQATDGLPHTCSGPHTISQSLFRSCCVGISSSTRTHSQWTCLHPCCRRYCTHPLHSTGNLTAIICFREGSACFLFLPLFSSNVVRELWPPPSCVLFRVGRRLCARVPGLLKFCVQQASALREVCTRVVRLLETSTGYPSAGMSSLLSQSLEVLTPVDHLPSNYPKLLIHISTILTTTEEPEREEEEASLDSQSLPKRRTRTRHL